MKGRQRAVWVGALWVLCVGLAVFALMQARFTADMSFFLPANPSPRQQVLVDQLGEGSTSRMLMASIEAGSTEDSARLSLAVADRLRASGLFASVQNGDSLEVSAERDYLLAHRYLLSPGVTPERFSVDGLRTAVDESVALLSSSAGELIKPYFLQDPTGELWAQVLEMGLAAQPNTRHGVWFSKDGQRAMLLLQTRAAGPDTDGQAHALAALERAIAQERDSMGMSPVVWQASGPGAFAVRARDFIQSEVTRVTAVGIGCIVLVLLLVYRSPRRLVLGLVPVISGALAGMLAVAWWHGTVFGITVGFGTALIGEGVDYAVYYFLQAGRVGEDVWRRRFWPTIRLGVLTSVAGFGTLAFSGFPGLSQLGIYATAGVITAALVTRWVLPALAPSSATPASLTRLGQGVRSGLHSLHKGRWPVLGLGVTSAVWLVWGATPLWSQDLSVLNTASAEDMRIDQRLRQDLGAPDARYLVVVKAASEQKVLEQAEDVGRRLVALQDKGQIGGFDTPVRFLPSQRTQQVRQAAIPDEATLRTRLDEALDGLPVSAARLEPFIEAVQQARSAPLLSRQSLEGTGLGLAVEALLSGQGEHWQAVLPLRPAQNPAGIDAEGLRQALAGTPALVIDMKAELDALYDGYMQQAIWLCLLGGAIMLVVMVVMLRSLQRVLRVLMPLGLTVVLLMAGLTLAAGHSLHLLHLVGLLLVLAVGSNYGLFFDSADAIEAMAPDTLAAMLVANLTTTIGFGALAFSEVPMLKALGLTVGPGAVLVLLLSAMFAPGLKRRAGAASELLS
ncbi:MMPL family transporter [Hydrogenophaga sp. 5NK40-0174]|uniref:MMPL family transporter n=1 Tax=Hydrogenophaga sp. 5NK40-0174 TaxID=3127649 RepID=UPI00310B4A4E